MTDVPQAANQAVRSAWGRLTTLQHLRNIGGRGVVAHSTRPYTGSGERYTANVCKQI
jgi:hypothetical protein